MRFLAAAVLTTALLAPAVTRAQSTQAQRVCNVPFDIVRLANPLPHVAQRLIAGEPVTIVAIGSSSTAGAGASSPAASYPSRLQVELSQQFPRSKFTVLNRGVNGEEVADMVRRFDTAVVAENPDLVLWQIGTNSVIRDRPLIDHGASIRDGINAIKLAGADVVLIDPQFAPKVIVKAEAARMVELIGVTAKIEAVDLFHRFDLMRHWHDIEQMMFEEFVTADGLHMNDWGYGCVAKALAVAIAEAVTRPVASAAAQPRAVP